MIQIKKLFLISGPSGCGKTTIMRSIMANEVVSFTTRGKRKGEVEGKDYLYISKDEFNKLKNNNGLIESVEYGGNYYGITKEELETKTNRIPAFCIVDLNGMKQLSKLHPDTTSIFIYTDYETAKKNMISRGDDPEKIEQRLSTYDDEIKNKGHYDYVIKNIACHMDYARNAVKSATMAESIYSYEKRMEFENANNKKDDSH